MHFSLWYLPWHLDRCGTILGDPQWCTRTPQLDKLYVKKKNYIESRIFSATNKIYEWQDFKVSFLFEIHSSLTCTNRSKYFFLCEQRTKHSFFFLVIFIRFWWYLTTSTIIPFSTVWKIVTTVINKKKFWRWCLFNYFFDFVFEDVYWMHDDNFLSWQNYIHGSSQGQFIAETYIVFFLSILTNIKGILGYWNTTFLLPFLIFFKICMFLYKWCLFLWFLVVRSWSFNFSIIHFISEYIIHLCFRACLKMQWTVKPLVKPS